MKPQQPGMVVGQPVKVNNGYQAQGYPGQQLYGDPYAAQQQIGPPPPAQYDPSQNYGNVAAPLPNCYGLTSPTTITCPSCHANCITKTTINISSLQWLIYVLLFLFFPLCCCAPCYVASCYQVRHNCSCCGMYVGSSQ